MDAFFASVEERDHPWMKGMPIVVGADPEDGHGRGVVSTANYAARAYGIRSAMPIRTAWRLAEDAKRRGLPKTIFTTPSMRRYGEASKRIMAILRAASDAVEVASIDEAYLDLSSSGTYTKAAARAKKIQSTIARDEHLTASVGIGPNKLIAKIASDQKKPQGLTVVMPELVHVFLSPLPVRVIPGIGPKAEEVLIKIGARTAGDLAALSRETLEEYFGRRGIDLYRKARGEDDHPIDEERHEPKSIGEQETFHDDTGDPQEIVDMIEHLAQGVFRRMKREGCAAFKTVVVTVRFGDFETVSRSHTLKEPADSAEVLTREALRLTLPFLDARGNPRRKKIRLLGVRIEHLGVFNG